MIDVTQSMACIQCGACVSSCLSMEADPDFIGPAALAKAYRFVGDPRDAETRERLYDLAQDPQGIYDCTHCFSCIDACPKGVAPMDQIMRLRRLAGHEEEHQRRQQRPPPRARLREDHREEGHARRVPAAPGVLRARRQGQAEADEGRDQGPGRLDPNRHPRHPDRQDALDPQAHPRRPPEAPGRRAGPREAHLLARRGEREELNLYVVGEGGDEDVAVAERERGRT